MKEYNNDDVKNLAAFHSAAITARSSDEATWQEDIRLMQ